MEDLSTLVEEALQCCHEQIQLQGVSLRFQLEPGVAISVPNRVRFVLFLTHCIQLSMAALQGGSGERVLTIRSTRFGGDQVTLSLVDNGRSIPVSVGEEFLKFAGGHEIIQGGRGKISIQRDLEGRNEVSIQISARAEMVSQVTQAASLQDLKESDMRALVIEDSRSMGKFLSILVSRHGFHAEHVEDGYAALLKLRQQEYDLIFLDLNMPGIDGRLLYKAVLKEAPQIATRFIVVSGEVDKYMAWLEENQLVYVRKPFTPEMISTAIEARRGTR